jgi:hypothetical protein
MMTMRYLDPGEPGPIPEVIAVTDAPVKQNKMGIP